MYLSRVKATALAGAALCFIDNRWAIGVIVLLQLNLAPEIPVLEKM